MGYRSDVGLCVTREAKTIGGDTIVFSPSDEMFQGAEVYESKEQLLFIWDCVKWGFDTEVEDVISNLNVFDFLFIRLGESDDDTEIIGHMFDNDFDFGWTRSLVYDGSSKVPEPQEEKDSLF